MVKESVEQWRQAQDRKRMVLAMEFIARHINDESIFWDVWAENGVADGDIPYGSFDTENVDDYYIEDEPYEDLCSTFRYCMKYAMEDGFCSF